MGLKKNGILDPKGKYKNPFTGKKYTERYLEHVKKWSNLPVYIKGAAEEVIHAIQDNRVIVLEAGTGSGKTVLVPKYALHTLNYKGKVIVTVPKQVIAASNARRDAEWMDVTLGEEVGFQYRGARLNEEEAEIKGNGSPKSTKTKLLFSTSGSLVSILTKDPSLKDYNIVIIDEAHERSTDIDEALLYMKRALRLNKKLKLIIMSATLPNADLFLNYYQEFDPTHLEFPGKSNKPVELEYLKKNLKGRKELFKEIDSIVFKNIIGKDKKGDILIFVNSGGEGIELKNMIESRDSTLFVIVLISGINEEDEYLAVNKDAYKDYGHGEWSRRVVIATNVAESSITIEGLTYVLDPGTEIKTDFDPLSQTNIMKVNPITRAQADQRKGRVGRNEKGYCYRLYTSQTFQKMKPSPKVSILSEDMTYPFLKYLTSPNIKNLLELVRFVGELIEVPSNENVISSIKNLNALNIVDGFYREGVMTDEGKLISKLVIDGKLDDAKSAKAMLVARFFRVEQEMSIIVSILSSTKKGLSDFFSGNGSLLYFFHPYGDVFTVYKAFLKYVDAEIRLTKKELNKWCKDNNVKSFMMDQVKEKSKTTYKNIRGRLSKVEQINEEYHFKNNDEALLFSLFKGFYLNLAKKKGKGYQNFYPDKKTETVFSDSIYDENWMRKKDLPKYIFYKENFKFNRRNSFLMVTAVEKEMIDLLLPDEKAYLEID
jgi:HrpA-like RNA helicase